MEFQETPNAAEIIANDFATRPPTNKASAHINVDNNSAVRCVDDNDVAFAAPGANSDGLQMELTGFGRQTRAQWLDDYGRAMLAIAIPLVAQWCFKHAIPVRHLTDYELANDEKGIVGHYQVSRVYKRSTHTDPGDGFPWDAFILGVGTWHAAPTPPPKPNGPRVGDRRWSNYFRKWIILARYQDDDNWWFTTDDGAIPLTKAATAWSKMPLQPTQ